MPRIKAAPFPDPIAYNLRKRAEQMEAIANTVDHAAAREVLKRRADDWRRMADELETKVSADARTH